MVNFESLISIKYIMSFLGDVIQPFIIRNTTKKSFSRQVKLQNFDDIQNICVVVEMGEETGSPDMLETIASQYQADGKAVEIIVFYSSADLPAKLTASSFIVLKKNDLNFFGLLKRSPREFLSQKKYDLAVCYNPGNAAPVAQAFALLQARFKAGTPGSKGFVPELVLHAKKQGMMHFIETINSYLKKLNQSS